MPVLRNAEFRLAADYQVGSSPGAALADSLEWQDRALCLQGNPEAFYPTEQREVGAAKRVCRSCKVITECLDYALAHNEVYGVWGGLSEAERRRLLRNSVGQAATS